MAERAPAGSARARLVVGTAVGLVVALAVLLWWFRVPHVLVGARRTPFLEPDRVELAAGFDDRTRLELWNDVLGRNPDRDEVGALMPRVGLLRWRLDGGPGRFVAQVARRTLGPGEDLSRAVVTVRAVGGAAGDEPLEVGALVPPLAGNPGAGAQALREGSPVGIALQVPLGAEAIEVVTEAPDGFPDGSVLLLLSPRYDQAGRSVRLDEWPLRYALVTDWLLPMLAPEASGASWTWARRRERFVDPARQAAASWSDVVAPPWEAVGAFSGPPGPARPALALLGVEGAEAACQARVFPDTVLRGAVALDAVMPPDASCELQVLVHDEPAATIPIAPRRWTEIEVPLGRWAHEEFPRRIAFRLGRTVLMPDEIERGEIDFVTGTEVFFGYRAERIRAGLANPRLERPAVVPRREAGVRRPSVIVAHVETLRADVVGAFGGSVEGLTPNLDALAERSLVFADAFTPSPWTLPTTATHLTGLLPSAHGVVDHDRNVLPGEVRTLAERARDDGVTTAAFVTNDLLREQAGFARGFLDFLEMPYANARQVNAAALDWIDGHRGAQFLLFLHYFDPHHPFNAPGDFRTRWVEPDLAQRDVAGAPNRLNARLLRREAVVADDPDVRLLRQRYLGEVAWLDEQLGRLVAAVEARGIARSTVLVVVADHGEEFMDHGLHGHGSQLYDESLHVPLLIWAPGGQLGPPRRIEGVISTDGLFATILDVLGVAGDRVARPDLLTSARGRTFAFAETNKGVVLDGEGDPLRGFMTSVRTDEYLLVARELPASDDEGRAERDAGAADAGPPMEYLFYDLRRDPDARSALAPLGTAFEKLKQDMARALEWSRTHATRPLRPGADAEVLQRLRELGYVGDPR